MTQEKLSLLIPGAKLYKNVAVLKGADTTADRVLSSIDLKPLFGNDFLAVQQSSKDKSLISIAIMRISGITKEFVLLNTETCTYVSMNNKKCKAFGNYFYLSETDFKGAEKIVICKPDSLKTIIKEEMSGGVAGNDRYGRFISSFDIDSGELKVTDEELNTKVYNIKIDNVYNKNTCWEYPIILINSIEHSVAYRLHKERIEKILEFRGENQGKISAYDMQHSAKEVYKNLQNMLIKKWKNSSKIVTSNMVIDWLNEKYRVLMNSSTIDTITYVKHTEDLVVIDRRFIYSLKNSTLAKLTEPIIQVIYNEQEEISIITSSTRVCLYNHSLNKVIDYIAFE